MKYDLQVATYQHKSIIKDAHNTLKHNLNIKVHFEEDQILNLVVKQDFGRHYTSSELSQTHKMDQFSFTSTSTTKVYLQSTPLIHVNGS